MLRSFHPCIVYINKEIFNFRLVVPIGDREPSQLFLDFGSTFLGRGKPLSREMPSERFLSRRISWFEYPEWHAPRHAFTGQSMRLLKDRVGRS